MSDERTAWAVYHPEYGWLADTCAGGTYHHNVLYAVEYASSKEAERACFAAEIFDPMLVIVRIR